MPNRPILSRAEVENFDPQGPPTRRWCPLCGPEKPRDSAHRCLSIDIANGLFHCFRCGAKGQFAENRASFEVENPRKRVLNGLKRAFALETPQRASAPPQSPENGEKSSWRESLRALQPLCGTPGEKYLAGRGLSLAVAESAKVKWSPSWKGRGAVVFPLYDHQNHLVAAQGRYCDPRQIPKARTLGPKKEGAFSTGQIWEQVRAGAPLIVTEAPIDALSLAQSGFPALALCGTSGPRWLPLAGGLREIWLAFDSDEAGERAAQALSVLLTPFGARCQRLCPEDAKDWNEMLLARGGAALGDWLNYRTRH